MLTHPIPSIYDENSKILILGSFPSVKSREEEFFYGHRQNRFWRVISTVLGAPLPITNEEKCKLLLSNNIALWDVVGSCDIRGSSDSSIKNATPNPLPVLISKTKIEKIYLNGKTAEKYFRAFFGDTLGIEAVTLPSTSPANAKMSPEKLIREWSVVVESLFSSS